MTEYPTEAELQKLETYCQAVLTLHDVPELLQELWHYEQPYIRWHKPFLQLHTGGWSGNEDIIGTMMGTLFWTICWRKSERGGHYWFRLPSWKKKVTFKAYNSDLLTSDKGEDKITEDGK